MAIQLYRVSLQLYGHKDVLCEESFVKMKNFRAYTIVVTNSNTNLEEKRAYLGIHTLLTMMYKIFNR